MRPHDFIKYRNLGKSNARFAFLAGRNSLAGKIKELEMKIDKVTMMTTDHKNGKSLTVEALEWDKTDFRSTAKERRKNE